MEVDGIFLILKLTAILTELMIALNVHVSIDYSYNVSIAWKQNGVHVSPSLHIRDTKQIIASILDKFIKKN